MVSQALLDGDEMVRLLMLSDSKNESDLFTCLKKEAYTLLGRFDQAKSPKYDKYNIIYDKFLMFFLDFKINFTTI